MNSRRKIVSIVMCALMIATVFAVAVPVNVSANQPPVADAGPDQTVNEGDIVQFTGSNSYDPEGVFNTYTFDTSDEGFIKEGEDTRSDIHWDSVNGRVYIKSDRYDYTDERLVKQLPQTFTEDSGDWDLSAEFSMSQGGWWTHAYPIFIGEGDNTDMRWDANQFNIVWERSDPEGTAKNHIIAWYRGANSQLVPLMIYDSANLYTTYTAELSYDLSTKTLRSELYEAGTLVDSGEYVIGTNSNDGFTFDELGVAANGLRGKISWIYPEPPVVGWTDNIGFNYFSSTPSLTYDWDFDSTDESFIKEDDDTRSDIHWDSVNGRVHIKSDRYDYMDERLVKYLPQSFTDNTGDWELSAEFSISQGGWWTHAYPIFIGEGDNTDMRWDANQFNIVWERSDPEGTAKNHIIAWYRGANSQLVPLMIYDSANLYTIYTAKLSYDVSTEMLRAQLYEAGTLVDSGNYAIGTNPNDGFTFDKVGVAANGLRGKISWIYPEPPVVGWTDNIKLDYYSLATPLTYEWDFDASDGIQVDATGPTPTHAYGDNGVYTVTLTVTDAGGLTDTDTCTVTVNNVAPTVDAGDDQTTDEGTPISFSGSFTDPGWLDTHTIEWDFGDGGTASGTLTPTHTYRDNGVYTVTLTVTDDDGGVGIDTLTVTVNNVAPTVSIDYVSDTDIFEGESVEFRASYSDPAGAADAPFTIVWNFGDGTGDHYGLGLNPTHLFADDNPTETLWDYNTVTVTVTDKDGGTGHDSTDILVRNVDPIVEIGRRFGFDNIIDDEWWYDGAWTRITPGMHHPVTASFTVGTLESGDFNYTHDETQIFKINVRHKLEIGTLDHADIIIARGDTILDVSESLSSADNTDWEIRTYDISEYLVASEDPITVKFRMISQSGDTSKGGWYIDYVDVIGLDAFSTGELEIIYFRSEVQDVPADTYTYLWLFKDRAGEIEWFSTEANPEYDYIADPPVSADLTVWDDDGGKGQDQGVGSVIIVPVDPDGQMKALISEIRGMPDDYFGKNPEQRRKALLNKFEAVSKQMENGAIQGAINKLNNDIKTKMDGSLGGNPKNDWIVDPLEQQVLTNAIDDLIYSLSL